MPWMFRQIQRIQRDHPGPADDGDERNIAAGLASRRKPRRAAVQTELGSGCPLELRDSRRSIEITTRTGACIGIEGSCRYAERRRTDHRPGRRSENDEATKPGTSHRLAGKAHVRPARNVNARDAIHLIEPDRGPGRRDDHQQHADHEHAGCARARPGSLKVGRQHGRRYSHRRPSAAGRRGAGRTVGPIRRGPGRECRRPAASPTSPRSRPTCPR